MSSTRRILTCTALVIGAVGCQDLPTEPRPSPESAVRAAATPSLAITGGIDASTFGLPAGALISDLPFGDDARRAIDPADYICAGTALGAYYSSAILEVFFGEPAIFDELFFDWQADIVVLIEALFLLTDETPQSFGYAGEYTKVVQKTHKDSQRFWDIPSSDIQVLALKGTMLLDVDRVTAAYIAGGVPPAIAAFAAARVRELMLESDLLNGGNHPIFSFNAFASSDFDGPLEDRVVLGDGVLAGYEALGLGDVAPQAIYAHEFAHHIQYENDYFDDPIVSGATPAEQTRYTELMADAMAAYFLAHKRGATLNQKRVELFLQVFFEVGDCSFTSPGHHGTPNQRMAASEFGFELAAAAQKQGHILSAEEFHDLFVAAYPDLIAPDA